MKLKFNKKILFSFVALSSLLLVGCKPKVFKDTKNRNMEDYASYHLFDIHTSMYTQKEDSYLIYIYRGAIEGLQTECPSCTDIKGVVLDFFDSFKEKGHKNFKGAYLYNWQRNEIQRDSQYFKIANQEEIEKQNKEHIGVSTTEETYILGTPALYFITDHKLSGYIYSTNDIGNWFYKNK